MTAQLTDALARVQSEVEIALAAALDDCPMPDRLRAAAGHSLLGGGKRLRAFLVLESARLHGIAGAMPGAVAIEALHAYSLIHDDLPAMDDDDLRRGKPTCHVAFDEATAILAGDGLQALAFDHATRLPGNALTAVAALARAAGCAGMVGGQMRDIQAEAGGPADIERIQAEKTGALFRWSASVGPLLAGDDPAPLIAYAEALGRAFQIKDDLLDHEGEAHEVGKATGKDQGAGKATFITLLGADGARTEAERLTHLAVDALAPYGKDADRLAELAGFVIARRH